MRFKHTLATDVVNAADLLDFGFCRIWLGDTDPCDYNGLLDAFRRAVLRNKVNMWIATQTPEALESGHTFKMSFYLGVFYRPLVVNTVK